MLNIGRLGRVGFGAAGISGSGGGYAFGDVSEKEALKVIQYAYERGIKVFDSAPIYGFGDSEMRLGLALKRALKQNREDLWLVSKSGVTWHPNKRVNINLAN